VAGIGLVLGLAEAIDSFFIGWGAIASVTFALLFLLGVWLTMREHVAGPVLIAVMCALEIAVFPGLERETTTDWVLQVSIAVISGAVIVSAVAALLERRRKHPATSPS
jgi:hypothetical protein